MSGRVLQIDPAAHKVADVLLPWLVNGTLEGEEQAFVEQHVAACPRCQREMEWLREFHAACTAGESSEQASSAFRSLKRKLDARPDTRVADRLRAWLPRTGFARWVIAAEFAVIAVLGAALFAGVGEPSLYRRLVALGHRLRILGGTCLGRAFAADAARSAIELLPAGAETTPAFLNSLDCFLYRKSPDWYETGGTVVLEAMAMKVPVVLFDDCGAADWVDSDRTGFVVRTEDEALAAIRRLASDPLLRGRIGVAARVHAIELVERQRDASLAFYLGDGARKGVAARRDVAVAGGISPVEIG